MAASAIGSAWVGGPAQAHATVIPTTSLDFDALVPSIALMGTVDLYTTQTLLGTVENLKRKINGLRSSGRADPAMAARRRKREKKGSKFEPRIISILRIDVGWPIEGTYGFCKQAIVPTEVADVPSGLKIEIAFAAKPNQIWAVRSGDGRRVVLGLVLNEQAVVNWHGKPPGR